VREIDFKNDGPMEISEFQEYFEPYRAHVVEDLVKDYEKIGNTFLHNIEQGTIKNDMTNDNPIKIYFKYWERRIFNAITKMIIRGLASIKTLYART